MKPPSWLTEVQAGFGAVLRSPLSSDSGTFAEDRSVYPPAFVDELDDSLSTEARRLDRIALYHRQYWMRLFTTLQGQYPRFAWALGYFHFNRMASLFLGEHAPRGFDIEHAGAGLGARLRQELDRYKAHQNTEAEHDAWQRILRDSAREHQLLTEALTIDKAERRVFVAAVSEPWQPTSPQLAALHDRRLQFAPGFALVSEHWDLVRHSSLFRTEGAAPTPETPLRLAGARCWVLQRTAHGITSISIGGEHASFLSQCRRVPFGAALAALEASATEAQSAVITRELRGWIRQAIELGWWTGVR